MSQVDQADRALMDNKQPKHTPSPWTLDPIAGAAGNYYIYSDADHGALIAKVDCRECGTEQAEANAKLIAAAPDLAEALLEIRLYADGGSPVHPGSLLIDRVREALTKAGL